MQETLPIFGEGMNIFSVMFLVTLIAVFIFHFLSVFMKENIAKIVIYANIALHIVMFFELLLIRVSLEMLAIIFMSSLLIYLLLSFIRYKKSLQKEVGGEEAEDDL